MKTALLIIIVLSSFAFSQDEISDRLKSFLNNEDFPTLIDRHAQEKVILKNRGAQQARIDSLPYTLEPGFRCQVFAGSQETSAEIFAERVRRLELAPVYIVRSEGGLFKVQAGNFPLRKDAELLLEKLRQNGLDNAWVVQTDVEVPRAEEDKPIVKSQEETIEEETSGLNYRIQVAAIQDQQRAEQLRSRLQTETGEAVEIRQGGDFWKVLVGKFQDRDALLPTLEKLHQMGFGDAYPVQIID